MINLGFYSKSVCLVGLSLTLSTYALQAQSQTKKINWQAVYSGFDQEGNPTQMLSGEGVFPAEQDHFIPYIQVKINGFSNDIRLKNVQTVDLSKDELQKLEPTFKISQAAEQLSTWVGKQERCDSFSIPCHSKKQWWI